MDWELTCRVCLEGGDMVSLFDCDENNEPLRDKYKYTTDIEVTESDTLPTLICLTCVDRLTFAYQFKQQCVTSNDTLKECLADLSRGVHSGKTNARGSEVVNIKQENGDYMQYELPIERAGELEVQGITPRHPRGRPKKDSNQKGESATSSSHSKESPVKEEKPSLSAVLVNEEIDLKEEHHDDGSVDYLQDGDEDEDSDPDYEPRDHSAADEESSIQHPAPALTPKKKRCRPAKKPRAHVKEEDILLKETIMAYTEPLADSILKPERKPQKKYPNKKNTTAFTCEICGNTYSSNQSLQGHIRRHQGIKPFVCSVCEMRFVIKLELRLHMLRHTGHKPYKCRICERRFADWGSRQKHERLHMGERPFHCTLCDKSFTYRNVLNNHMMAHRGEKKYACGSCNKKFTKSLYLNQHTKTHHKDVYDQQQEEREAKRKPLIVQSVQS